MGTDTPYGVESTRYGPPKIAEVDSLRFKLELSLIHHSNCRLVHTERKKIIVTGFAGSAVMQHDKKAWRAVDEICICSTCLSQVADLHMNEARGMTIATT